MVKTLLQQLYNGEIYPAEQIVPKNPQYRKLEKLPGAKVGSLSFGSNKR